MRWLIAILLALLLVSCRFYVEVGFELQEDESATPTARRAPPVYPRGE